MVRKLKFAFAYHECHRFVQAIYKLEKLISICKPFVVIIIKFMANDAVKIFWKIFPAVFTWQTFCKIRDKANSI